MILAERKLDDKYAFGPVDIRVVFGVQKTKLHFRFLGTWDVEGFSALERSTNTSGPLHSFAHTSLTNARLKPIRDSKKIEKIKHLRFCKRIGPWRLHSAYNACI